MTQDVHRMSNSIESCIITDGKCRASRAAAAGLLSCSNGGHKLFGGANTLLKSSPLHRPTVFCITCKSNNSHRRNPDFSRHQRGYSRGRNQHHQKRESLETLVETDLLPSKNGSLFSLSTNQRHSATATPGRREKEIVELFRKVQIQLRERAALKEEKKIETSQQGQQEERGTVDSLLNLLRKHSVAQGKTSGREEKFNLDQPEEETNTDFFSYSNVVTSDDVIEPDRVPFSRPASKFRRRSPVSRVKFQPVFSEEKDSVDEPEQGLVAFLEEPSEKSLDELSDSSDDDDDHDANVEVVEASIEEITDLASLKLHRIEGPCKISRAKRVFEAEERRTYRVFEWRLFLMKFIDAHPPSTCSLLFI